MRNIKLKDYINLFDMYVKNFKSHKGVYDICLSGTINDPGISDIDVLLIIDNWDNFEPTFKLLNPERISNFFFHGPLVCNKKYLNEFFSLTNMKILKNSNTNNFKNYKTNQNNQFNAFVRQCFYIINFKNFSINKDINRSNLLNLKSIIHSMDDLIYFNFIKEYQQIDRLKYFSKNLRYLYKQNNFKKLKNQETREISTIIKNFFYEAEISLNEYFNTQLVKNKNFIHFNILIDKLLDKNYDFKKIINNFYIENLNNYRNFLIDNINGNISTNSFMKGSDFIIASKDIKRKIGKKIWIRRVNKKILNRII